MTADQLAVSRPTIQTDADPQLSIVHPVASPSIDSAQLGLLSAQRDTVLPQVEPVDTEMDLDTLAADAADGKAKDSTSVVNDEEPSRAGSTALHENHAEQVAASSQRSQTKETQTTQAEETLSQIEEDLQTRNALRNIASSQDKKL